MRPILFEVRGLAVPAYGCSLAVLFILGLLLLRRRTRELGMRDQHILDLAAIAAGTIVLWLGAGSLLARLKWAGPAHLNALPVLGIGAFAYLRYLRRHGLPAERIFDVIAPIAAGALAVQYGFGTLLAGTAFGTPTDLPWGLSFPPGSPAYRIYGALPLHPVQVYLGIIFGIIAVVAFLAPTRLRAGTSALLTFIAISCAYLATSPLRGGTTSFATGTPRMSELVAVFILLFSLTMLWRTRAASVRT